MKRIAVQDLLIYRWRYAIGYTVLLVLGLVALFWQLGTLVPGASPLEVQSGLHNLSFSHLWRDPVNWIFNGLQTGFIKFLGTDPLILRLPGVFMGIVTAVLFYALLRIWYWPRIAIMGSLVLITASWFLHQARFGAPISMIMPITLGFYVALTTALRSDKIRWWLASALIGAVGLYTPYFIYVLLVAIIININTIIKAVRQQRWYWTLLSVIVLGVLLAPMGLSIANEPGLAKTLLGIPDQLPSILDYLSNIASVFGHLFWRSEAFPQLHLGTLPMLDIFTASMVALGLYHYERHLPSVRSKTILLTPLVLVLTVALANAPTTFVVLLPFIYILAANGVSILLRQWYNIFPKNPIARTVAVVPLGLLLIVVFAYHYQRYFIAWPRTPEVVAAFSEPTVVLENQLSKHASKTILIIAASDNEPAYTLAAHDNERTKVINEAEATSETLSNWQTVMVDERANIADEINASLEQRSLEHANSSSTENNLVFLVYSTEETNEE